MVLVFGGSQGAQSINRACVDAFGGEELGFQLVHVCGPKNEAQVRADLEARGERFERYRLVPYTDRLAAAMAAADLVVARSGGSVAELAALGKPAILVPYPYATADHQRKNAREMVSGGAALLVDDAELNGEVLARLVASFWATASVSRAMASASAALGRPDAAQRVADQIEDVMATNDEGHDDDAARDFPQPVHFVGIGGAGMSGIAAVLHELGVDVRGSDLKASRYTRHLDRGRRAGDGRPRRRQPGRRRGGRHVVGHQRRATPRSARRAPPACPSCGARRCSRASWTLRRGIAVAGTHGKTTTSSMISHVLRQAGMDPTFLVGGELNDIGSNAGVGQGEWLVAEADESDGSLLFLRPEVAIVSNVELDHHANYGCLDDVHDVFRRFVALLPEDGLLVLVAGSGERRSPRRRRRRSSPSASAPATCRPTSSVWTTTAALHGARRGWRRARPDRAARARRAQRPQRAHRARRPAPRGRRARRRGAAPAHVQRRRAPLPAHRRAPAACSSSTTTPITRPRSPPRSRRRCRATTSA